MIIYVYGDDSFHVQKKVTELRNAFIKKHDPSEMNTVRFPASGSTTLDPPDILQSLRSAPFLSEKRMVIIQDLLKNGKKDHMKTWLDGLKDVPESTVLVLSETMSVKQLERRKLFKALKEQEVFHAYPFSQMSEREISSWIEHQVKHARGSIAPDAVRELQQRVGLDLWQLSTEIDKLNAYAGGTKITASMVEMLVRPSFEGQIFDLVDAISQKQQKKALRLLEQERHAGANDFYLLTMLARQIRLLIGARALLDKNKNIDAKQVANSLNIHPFVAKKVIRQARQYSLVDLRRAHSFVFHVDGQAKTGGMNVGMAVDLTTINLLK